MIIESGARNLIDLLQQINGLDIRRQGVAGTQADLYIRGGGFDQTLLLIDGMKMDDVQTGHHTLNLLLPIQLIDRIEIIKGPMQLFMAPQTEISLLCVLAVWV